MTILRKNLCIIGCERNTRHILIILIAYYEGKRIRRFYRRDRNVFVYRTVYYSNRLSFRFL